MHDQVSRMGKQKQSVNTLPCQWIGSMNPQLRRLSVTLFVGLVIISASIGMTVSGYVDRVLCSIEVGC